jgi:hypothetical protein
MARPKPKTDIVDERGSTSMSGDTGDRPTRTWAKSHGTYIAGRSLYRRGRHGRRSDGKSKWGVGRLRLLVPAELREKFDRQRYLLNQAIWHGDLGDVQREAPRMARAWRALDAKATTLGQEPLSPVLWEIPLADGSVAVLARDNADASQVCGERSGGGRLHARRNREASRREQPRGEGQGVVPGGCGRCGTSAVRSPRRLRRFPPAHRRAADVDDEIPW